MFLALCYEMLAPFLFVLDNCNLNTIFSDVSDYLF